MNHLKKAIHFTAAGLLQPTNPVTVNLIGVGGTGTQVLTALARMSYALRKLGHTGLQVRVFDDDRVSEANLGRQLFAPAEVGLYKGVALINRVNRFFGMNWKAIPERYGSASQASPVANITVSCVDTVQARREIAGILTAVAADNHRDSPLYWMDFGNGRDSGQVILSTIGEVAQPASEKFRTVGVLPMVTEEFGGLLDSVTEDAEPSCSLAEALERQDLFINSALADMGASLLWQLFSRAMTPHRGCFLNLDTLQSTPLKVG